MVLCCCNPNADWRHLFLGAFGCFHSVSVAGALFSVLCLTTVSYAVIIEKWEQYHVASELNRFSDTCNAAELTPWLHEEVLSKPIEILLREITTALKWAALLFLVMTVCALVGSASAKMKKAAPFVFVLLVIYVGSGIYRIWFGVSMLDFLQTYTDCLADNFAEVYQRFLTDVLLVELAPDVTITPEVFRAVLHKQTSQITVNLVFLTLLEICLCFVLVAALCWKPPKDDDRRRNMVQEPIAGQAAHVNSYGSASNYQNANDFRLYHVQSQ
ncbi:unnamed protein product [Amoebophrya sp. A120]|nr:unnamed protein product [Amoebophrya sp. A120]|eukprot:GSA120T00009295001.1